jgi:hypothetical protein
MSDTPTKTECQVDLLEGVIEQHPSQSAARADLWNRLFGLASKDLLASFKKFHIDNPHIYELFANKANIARRSGRLKYSAWVIINVLRWEYDIQTAHTEFKISNDHIAIYARLLIWNDPSFYGFFELKRMNPDRHIHCNLAVTEPDDNDDDSEDGEEARSGTLFDIS